MDAVCSRNQSVIKVWAWMLSLITVCSPNTNAILVCTWMLWSMLSKHARHFGLGMDALVTICSPNTDIITLWKWMLWSPTVCSWNTNVIMVWAWMLWSPYAFQTPTLLRFGDGCSGHRRLSKRERYYGLGMDALVTVCSRNTNVFMAWVCGRAKALENPRQNMHRGPTTM